MFNSRLENKPQPQFPLYSTAENFSPHPWGPQHTLRAGELDANRQEPQDKSEVGEPPHIHHQLSVAWKSLRPWEWAPLPKAAQLCSHLPLQALQSPDQPHKTQKEGGSVIQIAGEDVSTKHTEEGTSWACGVIFVL